VALHPSTADTHSRRLWWTHGEAELHAVGAMLAPVVFRAPDQPDFAPLQVAPWAEDAVAHAQWPGLLGRLRGDWPCVPFGRCDRPDGLPGDWAVREPGDAWGHGHAAHHPWSWRDAGPQALALQIELPADGPVRRLTRTVSAVADRPALDLALHIEVRRPCTLPIALHPTLRLDLGWVALDLAHDGPGFSYPVPTEPGRSRLAPGARFERLEAVPLAAGGDGDFSRYPPAADGEDLLQLTGLRSPVTARFLDAGWALTLDWDRNLLPDLMLWISHRGRLAPPWSGRHRALGVEPVNGAWDLGRVADPAPGHPLANQGLALAPERPCTIRSRLSAAPLEPAR